MYLRGQQVVSSLLKTVLCTSTILIALAVMLILTFNFAIDCIPNTELDPRVEFEQDFSENLSLTDQMKDVLKCYDQNYISEKIQQGQYWILKNYIQAGHGNLKCYESITLTSHGDFTFLEYLPTLVDR